VVSVTVMSRQPARELRRDPGRLPHRRHDEPKRHGQEPGTVDLLRDTLFLWITATSFPTQGLGKEIRLCSFNRKRSAGNLASIGHVLLEGCRSAAGGPIGMHARSDEAEEEISVIE
jgi:hypothetical protein